MNLTLNTAYPGSSEGLEWTLNSPSPEVASVTTTAGPAAVAAQKSLYCANQTCLLAGLNSSPLSDGVVATVTLTLSAAATGNLVVQVSNPVEALLDGTGGSITSANGMVSVDAISVTVTPTGASLHGAQSLQFSATVAGSANPNVTWTMTPMIGVLSSSGLYTAPQNILGSQTVVVTATSVADPTKSASVTITLLPAVVVSVTPAAASLGASQTQQFTASVNNTSNTVVIWSLLPAIGTLSNGLYTAAASIPTAQRRIGLPQSIPNSAIHCDSKQHRQYGCNLEPGSGSWHNFERPVHSAIEHHDQPDRERNRYERSRPN